MDTNATTDDDVKAIQKLGEEYFAGANAGDLDRRMATMASDAIIMPPDRPSILGKEEVRRLSREYSATFESEYSLVYDEIETAGNWGFARATVTGTRTPKSGGAVEKVIWKNLWIVKRQADGKWELWRIIFNSAIPPQKS
jgi:ketosteroid isomerase-like protein